ncbi:aldose epimerase family protein [Roseisalinus antarcticus]|uniref:Aldose 1-epimerase n=1 Tax=Roseisalinus antarcticus TaxID=254357 RepID=A0A1Y5TUC6_9RHOB|nr:aldose epimerase family protein [Roseisalinus antarcticus]SLN72589.1 Aldose 1-epimerase precursor [Roseisalinus antarcticus]
MTPFGTLRDGRAVHAIPLSAGDLSVTILTYGAVIQSVTLAGSEHSLTPTSDRIEDWENGTLVYDGALVGPVANRIKGARASLDGAEIAFEANQEALHTLHSGSAGVHIKVWDVLDEGPDFVVLGLDLPAGEGNFPGNRQIRARFEVLAPATIRMTLTGTTDAPTFLNLCNHGSWNLDGTQNWTGHRMWIDAEHYLPTDETAAPTREIASVAGTDMDFRTERSFGNGAPAMDHNFCLSDGPRPLREVLRLTGASGTSLTLATTEPGVQIFDGRKGKIPYRAIAIEAQGWPDAANQPAFPSIVLEPGETYRTITEWRFARGPQA